MKTHFNSLLRCGIIAICFFLLGVFFAPSGKIMRSLQKKIRYTKSAATRLYSGWDKNKIYLEDGVSLQEYEQKNKSYIIYFWATWCPHCRNVTDEINSIVNTQIPLIGLPFDVSKNEYETYKNEKLILWQDLMHKDDNGERFFCSRTDSLNIPSIPSLWIMSNGKILEIYKGEKGIKKFMHSFSKI